MKPNVFVHVRIAALDVINSEVRTYIYASCRVLWTYDVRMNAHSAMYHEMDDIMLWYTRTPASFVKKKGIGDLWCFHRGRWYWSKVSALVVVLLFPPPHRVLPCVHVAFLCVPCIRGACLCVSSREPTRSTHISHVCFEHWAEQQPATALISTSRWPHLPWLVRLVYVAPGNSCHLVPCWDGFTQVENP
jgi:hypothetical protein